MRKILILLLIIPSITYGLTFKDGKQVDETQPNSDSQTSASVQTSKSENKMFKPFDCRKLETEHLRINNRNDCLIIHELSDKYEVKSVSYTHLTLPTTAYV